MQTKNIILAFILLISSHLFAQDFSASLQLDTFQIEIGDQVYLKLNLVQAENLKVQFPQFKNKIIEGIDIVSKSGIDTVSKENGKIFLRQNILITAFDDSLYTIPPFAFVSGADTVYTKSMSFDVQKAQFDSTFLSQLDTTQMLPIFDIEKPIDTPWTFKEFWQYYGLYIVLLLIAITLFFVGRYFYKRYKDNKPLFKAEQPKEPAHIIALRKLDKLKNKKLWQSGYPKEYYSELTYVLREYLENRYNINALEKTSHELIEMLRHTKLMDKELVEEFRQIFNLGDLAKFAKFNPLPDENDLSMKNAYSIIENTKIILEEKEETEMQNDAKDKTINSQKEGNDA
ncbi:MAG: hypothetical protein L3J74_11535 [Bacteroidales bacterium]|nr:hypothetical protein [Bacteroidales bacterium]